MKNIKYLMNAFAALAVVAITLPGCYKAQKDYDRTPHPIDPHIYKTAWQYLKDRATGATANDQIFSRMYEGILYAELDSNLYKDTGRTYIFLHNDAIRRLSGTTVQPDCFFGVNLYDAKVATAWNTYPKDFVKNYFLYLIQKGVYDHYTLPAVDPVEVNTMAPAGVFNTQPDRITRHANFPFAANPGSTMKIKVLNSSPSNTSDYPIVLNENRNVRTSSILATNGTIHVIDRYLTTTLP